MRRAALGLVGLLLVLGTACRSTPAIAPRSVPVPVAPPAATALPQPIRFPRDDAPHDALTEWWYYTGHLDAADGASYGFELVVFQSVRGDGPVGYAAHYAITDARQGRFRYDQRTSVGSQIGRTNGFDLRVGGWSMRGADGHDHLAADMPDYTLDLALDSRKPAALHNEIGLISFGPAGDSYYYSRTRMDARGTLTVDGVPTSVTGLAWMDHQWGNFISVGGGWDWFSVQLDDGSDLTASIVRDDAGTPLLVYGTYVERNGQTHHLGPDAFRVETAGRWTSPRTGATYPSGWTLTVVDPAIQIDLRPVLVDQELDTRATTGVAYWEGAVDVTGRRDGRAIAGRGYVELTGYAAGLR